MIPANKQILIQRWPALAAKLASYPATLRVFWAEDQSGYPQLRSHCAPDRPFITGSDILRIIRGKSLEDIQEVFLLGIGNGFALDAFLRKAPQDCRIFQFLINPEHLLLLLRERDVNAQLADPRLELIDASCDQGKALSEALQDKRPHKREIFYDASSIANPPPDLAALCEILRRRHALAESQRISAPLLAENIRRNRQRIEASPDLSILAGALRERAVVIVAAGPSLDRNIDALTEASGYLPIICVDTAYRRLHQAGISPDAIAISDPNKISLRHFEALPLESPLIFLASASWHVIAQHRGPLWPLFAANDPRSGPLAAELGRSEVDVCGTVTYFAAEAAMMLGASTLIFAGLDLALSGGKSHCSASRSSPPGKGGIWVDATDGSQVECTADLNRFRLAFEERAAALPRHRFIDATEGGARIAGFEISTLSDAIDSYKGDRWQNIFYPGADTSAAQKRGDDLAY